MFDDPDEEDEWVLEWWLWRMSDGSLLPVSTDGEGVDRPLLGTPHERMLMVDELLQTHAEVRDEPPAHVDLSVLTRFTVGRSAILTMAVSAVVALAPGVPNALGAIGALSFWVGPVIVAMLVGRRRRGLVPPDLRSLAQAAMRRDIYGIRPIRWRGVARWLVICFAALIAIDITIALLSWLADVATR